MFLNLKLVREKTVESNNFCKSNLYHIALLIQVSMCITYYIYITII